MDAVSYRSEWCGERCGVVSNTAWCREVKAGVATAGMPHALQGRRRGPCGQQESRGHRGTAAGGQGEVGRG